MIPGTLHTDTGQWQRHSGEGSCGVGGAMTGSGRGNDKKWVG